MRRREQEKLDGLLRPVAGKWSARPRSVRRSLEPIPGWWKPFVYVPFASDFFADFFNVVVPHGLKEVAVGSVAFGLLSAFVLWAIWSALELSALREGRGDRAFSDAPPGIEEFPVEVVIGDAHGSLGADRGFVWFEDGLLTFNGAACSFVLTADDLYLRTEKNGKRLHTGLPKDAVRLRVPGKTVYVRLLPLLGRRYLGFGYRLGRFLASRPMSDRRRQWPPLARCGMTPKPYVRVVSSPEAIGDEAARVGSATGVVRTRP